MFNSFSSLYFPILPVLAFPLFSLLFRRVTFSQSPIFPFFVGGGWQQQQLDPPGPKGQKEGGAELFGQDFGRQRRSKRDGHSSRPSRPTRRRGQKDLPGANSFYSLCLRPQCPFMTRLVSPIVPTPFLHLLLLPNCCCHFPEPISSRQICPPIALLFFNSNSPSFPHIPPIHSSHLPFHPPNQISAPHFWS